MSRSIKQEEVDEIADTPSKRQKLEESSSESSKETKR